jgi:hypothetical protein
LFVCNEKPHRNQAIGLVSGSLGIHGGRRLEQVQFSAPGHPRHAPRSAGMSSGGDVILVRIQLVGVNDAEFFDDL